MMTMLDLFALVLMYHLTKFLFQAFYPSSSPTPTIFGGPTPPPTADDIIGALAAMRRTIDGQASTIATILDEVRSRPSSSTSTTTTITTNKRLSDVEKDADEEKKRVDRLAWASANLHKRLDGQEAKTLGLATHSPKRLEDAERLVSQQQRSIGNLEKVRAVIHDRNNRLVSQVEAKREEIRGQAKVVKVQAAEITRLRLELAVEKATRAAPRGYDRTKQEAAEHAEAQSTAPKDKDEPVARPVSPCVSVSFNQPEQAQEDEPSTSPASPSSPASDIPPADGIPPAEADTAKEKPTEAGMSSSPISPGDNPPAPVPSWYTSGPMVFTSAVPVPKSPSSDTAVEEKETTQHTEAEMDVDKATPSAPVPAPVDNATAEAVVAELTQDVKMDVDAAVSSLPGPAPVTAPVDNATAEPMVAELTQDVRMDVDAAISSAPGAAPAPAPVDNIIEPVVIELTQDISMDVDAPISSAPGPIPAPTLVADTIEPMVIELTQEVSMDIDAAISLAPGPAPAPAPVEDMIAGPVVVELTPDVSMDVDAAAPSAPGPAPAPASADTATAEPLVEEGTPNVSMDLEEVASPAPTPEPVEYIVAENQLADEKQSEAVSTNENMPMSSADASNHSPDLVLPPAENNHVQATDYFQSHDQAADQSAGYPEFHEQGQASQSQEALAQQDGLYSEEYWTSFRKHMLGDDFFRANFSINPKDEEWIGELQEVNDNGVEFEDDDGNPVDWKAPYTYAFLEQQIMQFFDGLIWPKIEELFGDQGDKDKEFRAMWSNELYRFLSIFGPDYIEQDACKPEADDNDFSEPVVDVYSEDYLIALRNHMICDEIFRRAFGSQDQPSAPSDWIHVLQKYTLAFGGVHETPECEEMDLPTAPYTQADLQLVMKTFFDEVVLDSIKKSGADNAEEKDYHDSCRETWMEEVDIYLDWHKSEIGGAASAPAPTRYTKISFLSRWRKSVEEREKWPAVLQAAVQPGSQVEKKIKRVLIKTSINAICKASGMGGVIKDDEHFTYVQVMAVTDKYFDMVLWPLLKTCADVKPVEQESYRKTFTDSVEEYLGDSDPANRPDAQ